MPKYRDTRTTLFARGRCIRSWLPRRAIRRALHTSVPSSFFGFNVTSLRFAAADSARKRPGATGFLRRDTALGRTRARARATPKLNGITNKISGATATPSIPHRIGRRTVASHPTCRSKALQAATNSIRSTTSAARHRHYSTRPVGLATESARAGDGGVPSSRRVAHPDRLRPILVCLLVAVIHDHAGVRRPVLVAAPPA